ncbi:MAG: hypothetical protein KKB37_03230 [Alphaproteobacteria bacterium]|nr:hypothetical protein [Alphaproteobacteria bacterium]
MIRQLYEKGILWPTLVVIPALVVLIMLGNWQWQRMHWKQNLLAELEKAAGTEPLPMHAVPWRGSGLSDRELETLRFRRVTVTGTFEHQWEMHVWQPIASGPAWSVVTPLRLENEAGRGAGGGEYATHVLVIRGVVPADVKPPTTRPQGQVGGMRSVTGRVRLDQPNPWANDPNIGRNEWFTRDVGAMAAYLGKQASSRVRLAPFFIEVEAAAAPPPAPQPRFQALQLSNRHLEYALTWWALAATLVAVYIAFVWSRWNLGSQPAGQARGKDGRTG